MLEMILMALATATVVLSLFLLAFIQRLADDLRNARQLLHDNFVHLEWRIWYLERRIAKNKRKGHSDE